VSIFDKIMFQLEYYVFRIQINWNREKY